jgi:hypothetical protein
MPIDITSNNGNGSIKPESVFSYSYSEEVTSISPAESKGGTGQLSFSAVAEPDSLLLVNNTLTLTDSERGSVSGQVKSIALNNGIVNITADTIMSRLNVSRTAGPIGGPSGTPATLLEAINYYCSLVSVTPGFDGGLDDTLDTIPVNFIGWNGNVWEYLKMLCSAVSASLVDDVPIEMYVEDDQLKFRLAMQNATDFSGKDSELSVSVDAFDAAQSVGVYFYDTSYGSNKVIYEMSNYAENADPKNIFKSSINDVMQVDAGETLTKRFVIDASLESVNQPTPVATITRIPPAPYAGITGEYVIVGSDDLPIQPSQWIALGGKLTISVTENPNEIEVTIVAPASVTMPTAENPTTEVTNAPYKIGAELGDYPAFWVTGTGVFFNKREKRFLTGAGDIYTSDEEAPTVDNPFISDLHTLSNRGVAAAQFYCGPRLAVNRTVAGGYNFGDLIGVTEKIDDVRFRYESADFNPSDIRLTGQAFTTITEFNETVVDKTFTEFNAAFDDLKFNEFTVKPLMGVN